MPASLETLAKAIPLTDREVELAKDRIAKKQGTVAEVVEGLLDERIGLAARSVRNYPPVEDIAEGWDGSDADPNPDQPPAQAPPIPPQVPTLDPLTGEPLLPESVIDERVADALEDAKSKKGK